MIDVDHYLGIVIVGCVAALGFLSGFSIWSLNRLVRQTDENIKALWERCNDLASDYSGLNARVAVTERLLED